MNFVDLTSMADSLHRNGPRPWAAVTGITLHQTASDLGEKHERWAKWPVPDPKTGKPYNESLRAHVGVTRGGQVLLVHPLDQLVYHGNGFNSHDVGVEISGTYEGVQGHRDTWWPAPGHKDPQVPTPEGLEAARQAVAWICAEVGRHGGRVKFIHAHRQSSEDRRSDPGSRIWAEVGLWAQRELGLSDGGPGFKVGTGRAIPREWDPSRAERY